MKKILITICVAVGVYFAFSNTIDEFLYPEKRPGLNTYDTYTTTTQQTTTAVTQQTPIVTDEDGYEPRDDRKPDYVQPADPTWSKRTFNWTSYDKRYTFEISMNIQDDMYEYYHSLLRYSYVKDYHNYVSDDNNHKLVKQLADEIKSLCDQCGYGESETIRETANFVQSIEYVDDMTSTGYTDFPKYPLETLYDQCGDCEDSSILLGALLKELGYGCIFIELPEHVAIGVKATDDAPGTYYDYNGSHYLYIETTNSGWDIGTLPDDFNEEELRYTMCGKISKVHRCDQCDRVCGLFFIILYIRDLSNYKMNTLYLLFSILKEIRPLGIFFIKNLFLLFC